MVAFRVPRKTTSVEVAMALGLAMVLSALLLPPQAFVWLLLGGLLGTVAVLVGYSYLVWRDDPDRSVTA